VGRSLQRRLVPKLELEKVISSVPPHPSPKVFLEQYTIPPDVAAEMLYIAAYVYDDIINKKVADLGCGTGRLAIGAAFLGSSESVGIDIDREAVTIAKKSSKALGLDETTSWIVGDLKVLTGGFDTVIQNPPFGVQRRGADRIFLERALEISQKVYSLHKNVSLDRKALKRLRGRGKLIPVNPAPFLERFIEEHGGRIIAVYAMSMTIPSIFPFHEKLRHSFIVDLYIIEA